jgi:AraC family transcriptional regulator
VKDEVINQIGLSVLSEMMNPTAAGRMLVETSSLMLAARLVHAHFDAGLARPTIESRHRLDDQRLRRVVDYVEDHLGDDIAVAISPKSRALASFTSHARSRPQQACHRIATSVRGAWSGLK